MGLRGIPAKSVGMESAAGRPGACSARTMKITHPDRLIWPALGIRKIDLVEYFEQIGEWFLPHVAGRPLTLVRCPTAWKRVLLPAPPQHGRKPGRRADVQAAALEQGLLHLCEQAAGVISVVQNGAVEFHTWGATVPEAQHPDRITLDLDPDPDLPWRQVMEGATLTRAGRRTESALLSQDHRRQGLHIVFPIERRNTWDEE